MVIEILFAKYLGEYQIELTFSDKIKRIIDFKSFIENSLNPMTAQFKDKKKFASFKIEFGDLVWGNFEMCFPIWDLHEGKICRK